MYMQPKQAAFFAAVRPAQDRIKAAMTLLTQAVELLGREGHVVIDAGIGFGRPYVLLAASPYLANMADTGRGAYYLRGVDEHGQHYRKGVLLSYRNVAVTWKERGH